MSVEYPVGLYAVYDTKAKTFNPPFTCPSDDYAIRMFTDLANDEGNLVGQHPEDFVLYGVGVFNSFNGTFIHDERFAEDRLVCASDVKISSSPPVAPSAA